MKSYVKIIASIFLFLFLYPDTLFGLNILAVIDFFPHPTRPFILNQITGLIDFGHNVTIYAIKGPKNELLAKEIDQYQLRSKIIYGKKIPKTSSFDIVYCMLGHFAPQFAHLKIKNNEKWKLVTAFHGYDATAVLIKNPHIYDEVFKIGDLFLPVSFYFRNRLIEAGCNPEKIFVHHVGINCNLFKFKTYFKQKNTTYNIVTIGRLEPLKGYEYAISAIAKLIKKGIKINYVIVGAGQLQQKLEKLVDSLNCKNNIKLVGLKNQIEVSEILKNADIFLLSSVTAEHITEGIPTVLMEAMAIGLPVISTNHAGIPELVKNNSTGFIVPERDVDNLSKKLEFLLKHNELWPLFGSTARKYIEKEHNIEIQKKLLNKFFVELCGKADKKK